MKTKLDAAGMRAVEQEFVEAGEAMQELDREVARSPGSASLPTIRRALSARALGEMEQAVERTVTRLPHNQLVKAIAVKARLVFEQELREAARKKALS